MSIALGFAERQASLHTTLHANTATTAVVFGTHGRIDIEGRFYAPTRFRVVRDDGTHWTFDGMVDAGMQYEAAEVARCVAAGLLESPLMTWQGTLDVMRTMDEIRRQIGLVYPSEELSLTTRAARAGLSSTWTIRAFMMSNSSGVITPRSPELREVVQLLGR